VFDLGKAAGQVPSVLKLKRKRDTGENGRQARKRQKRATAASESMEDPAQVAVRVVVEKRQTAAEKLVLRGKMFYGAPKRDKLGRLRPGLPPHREHLPC
jgi:hypothetical protein